MKKTTSPSAVHAAAHPKSAKISRLIMAAALLAELLVRWAARPVRAVSAGPVPPLASVSLEAIADTWLRQEAPTRNYGGSTTIQVSPNTTNRQTNLMMWDLTGIPANATVTAANLTFYVTNPSAFDFNLYELKRPWVEGLLNDAASSSTTPGANWNYADYQNGNPWGSGGARSITTDRYDSDLWDATTGTFGVSGQVTIPLNDYGVTTIQGWVASPGSNYGMTLQYQGGTSTSLDYWIVASSENETFPGPSLDITYSLPTISTAGELPEFSVHAGQSSTIQSYTVSAAYLTGNLLITAPASFEISTTSEGPFLSSLVLTPANGTISSTTIYVRFTPSTTGNFSGQITHASTGATPASIPVNGKSTNNAPSAASPSPGNGTSNVNTPVILTATIADADNDSISVSFFGRQVNAIVPEEFTHLYTAASVTSGSSVYALWDRSFTSGEEYEWYISMNDGFSTSTSPVWVFIAGEPTAVELNYFRASRTSEGVLLSWETVNEASLAGFNLYRREPGGEFIQVNSELITPQAGGQPLGSAYTFLDEDIPLNRRYEYRLEGIETSLQVGSFANTTFWPYSTLLPAVLR